MCSEAPDNSGVNAAALANAQISKEALDFYKTVYAEQAPARAESAAMAKEVSQQQLASSRLNDSISQDYWNYQKDTFRPLEEGIVADAASYDTPERREAEAGTAVADVGMQANIARQSAQRGQQRMGVNPNSGAAVAMGNQMTMAEAAAKAGAANTARKNVETIGQARKMDAASLGRGLAANQSTSASVALNAGNSAVASANAPQQQAQSAASMMGQGFQTGISGNNSAGQLYGQAADAQARANSSNSGMWSALGTVAGAAIMASDENKKEDIKPVSDEQALQAIEDTPVSGWKYKKGTGDGGRHVGPMAQHVKKTMGEKAAPDGKSIDLITMNGMTMAGIAALSRKVDKLSKKLEGAPA